MNNDSGAQPDTKPPGTNVDNAAFQFPLKTRFGLFPVIHFAKQYAFVEATDKHSDKRRPLLKICHS